MKIRLQDMVKIEPLAKPRFRSDFFILAGKVRVQTILAGDMRFSTATSYERPKGALSD